MKTMTNYSSTVSARWQLWHAREEGLPRRSSGRGSWQWHPEDGGGAPECSGGFSITWGGRCRSDGLGGLLQR